LPKIVKGDFPPPSTLNGDVSNALEAIMMNGMALRRADRLSARDFAHQLSEYLYTASPGFSGETVAHFMTFLFKDELAVEGRKVDLPKGFIEQLTSWRQSTTQTRVPRPATPARKPPTSPGTRPGSAPGTGKRPALSRPGETRLDPLPDTLPRD